MREREREICIYIYIYIYVSIQIFKELHKVPSGGGPDRYRGLAAAVWYLVYFLCACIYIHQTST